MLFVDPSQSTNLADDDRYTNSELFSNPGCQDDQMDILRGDEHRLMPDWMSETSEHFVPPTLPPPRPKDMERGRDQLAGLENLINTAPPGLLQQVSTKYLFLWSIGSKNGGNMKGF